MPRTLSKDIRLAGDTLGLVLRAHGGTSLFEHEEAMRLAAKRAREERSPEARAAAREALARIAGELEPEAAIEVVRAFTLYFQLVNVAEDVHRTRELRLRETAGGPESVAESLASVVADLASRGATRGEVLAALADLHVMYVFTAHPTEARRRTTERLLSTVREVLEDIDRKTLLPVERAAAERRLRASVEALWEHEAERRGRPEVLDEVKAGLWYLRNVLLDVVPRVHRRLCDAVERHYGPVDPLEMPMPASFGSWMGGDRDGNPFVTDAVTERTLELHRRIVLDRYVEDLDRLVDPLAGVRRRLAGTDALDDALLRAEAALPELVLEAERKNPDEPLRRLLTFMRERLVRTRAFSSGAYAGPQAFLEDVIVLRETLLVARAEALAGDALLDLVQRVRCFGFTLAALDVREDSRVHHRVVAELLGEPGYLDAAGPARLPSLARVALPDRSVRVSPEARRLLDLFATLRRLKARFGPEAIGTYIISMTEHSADVLEVLALAERHGIAGTLDIVPLFESRSALLGGGALLEELFADPRYAAHLDARGRVQEVLLGYSDSMKEGGIVESRVLIQEAQRAAAEVCRRHGVTLRIFHGRGGSVSRGGGPTYRAVHALPRESFTGCMKLTEQGEARADHFANPDLAARYLEQTIGAAIVARHEARLGAPPRAKGADGLLRRLSAASFAAYRDLVEDPGLLRYFVEATPFRSIAVLHIGSRPSRRAGATDLADLRAIPWVFAWNQSRHGVTGWYGAGSAIEAVASEAGGLERLEELYRKDPFFKDLLDNVQNALATADLHIAERYATLCADEATRARIFGKILEEHDRTARLVLAVVGTSSLLGDDSVLKRSIRLRNPYVDPLSYLQVEALRRARSVATEEEKAPFQNISRAAVQGIAAGLRSTG